MDYEKLHKDTITRLHQMVNSGKITVEIACDICADFVPESEDEKIRKELISFVRGVLACHDKPNAERDEKYESWIAWLEKQGEQNPVDKIELKFKVGDTVKDPYGDLYHITEITDDSYKTDDGRFILFKNQEVYTLSNFTAWSKEDEYVIERLFCLLHNEQDKYPQQSSEFQELEEIENKLKSFKYRLQPQSKWSEEDDKHLQIAINYTFSHGYLSTVDWLRTLKDRMQPKQEWKQENTGDLTDFENAMMHIGGSFFGDNAGLDPNDTNAIKEQANLLLELVPKQKWSEEDEKILKDIITDVKFEGYNNDMQANSYKKINWLKSLKGRVQPQCLTVTDEELSKAKKDAYNDALDKIEYHSGEPTFDDGWSAAIWYLKKRNIKPQNTWKPSDEQMHYLYWIANVNLGDSVVEQEVSKHLNELYADLKKLREE